MNKEIKTVYALHFIRMKKTTNVLFETKKKCKCFCLKKIEIEHTVFARQRVCMRILFAHLVN